MALPSPRAGDGAGAPFLELRDVSRSFGAVRAVSDVSLAIRRGERLGLVGHNGAGKSTLVNLLLGSLPPSGGSVLIGGAEVLPRHTVESAFALGVRCVFQELSLCANLNAYENLRLQHPRLRGPGWRRAAAALMRAALDEVFPGHSIDVAAPVGDFPIGARQMIEIARAFVETADRPVRLVVLDEPTASLDAPAAAALLAHAASAARRGVAILLISHRLREVISSVDRLAVLRDGRLVGDVAAAGLSQESLIEMMTGAAGAAAARRGARAVGGPVLLRCSGGAAGETEPLVVGAGEIVGLAGLEGHGQRELLHRIHLRRPLAGEVLERPGRIAYVTGDRQREGVFPGWSVERNLSVGLLRQLSRLGVLRPRRERQAAQEWRDRLAIRVPAVTDPILSLSGGNQQKVLIARAFASGAPLVLLDDPTRGVDVATKRELYERVRDEAERGRAFLWYTTEIEEVAICDRVHILRRGIVRATLEGAAATEEAILAASFDALVPESAPPVATGRDA